MPRVVKQVAPVIKRNPLEAAAQDLGDAGVATMPTTGAAEITQEIEVVDPARFAKEKADNLAFNEELVTVEVHTTPDKFAPQWVEISVNGQKELFWRGVPKTCKRKFVEGLARCKPVSYKNVEYVDADGSRSVKWPSTVGLEYPFSMLEDKNPRGRDWLRKLLREPV